MATLYKATGTQEEVKPGSGAAFTLEEIQGYVGGYFEMQHMSNGLLMLMDEHGKMKQKPVNRTASLLLSGKIVEGGAGGGKTATIFTPTSARHPDFVVGDVLVGTREEFGG